MSLKFANIVNITTIFVNFESYAPLFFLIASGEGGTVLGWGDAIAALELLAQVWER